MSSSIYDSSKLKRRIKIYRYLGQSDGAGGQLDDWPSKEGYEFVFSRWANVVPISGKYLYEARMAKEEITHDVIVRFNKKLFSLTSKKLHIDYDGRRFDVDYVIDVDDRHKFLKMRCIENHGKRRN